MTSAAGSRPRISGRSGWHRRPPDVADVFVVFGITGDLAKVMTFHSLYRLERRGLLSCPIVGVAVNDWSDDDLRDHARAAIENCGEVIDDEVFDRFAARLSYLSGDFGDAETYERLARAIGDARQPRVLPRDPAVPVRPGDQGAVGGRSDQDRAGGRREAVRPRPRFRPRAGRRDPPVHRRIAALPDRPLPGEDGARRDPLPAVRERDVRADLESQLRLERPDHDGGELRGGGSRALLRPGRGAPRRGRQPPDAGRRRGRDGGARRRTSRTRSRTRSLRRYRADAGGRSRALRARAVRRATGRSTGSRRTRPTETYAALRLEIDNWRWSGVPFFIRTGKCLPVTQTELRVVFRRPPTAGLLRLVAPAGARARWWSSSIPAPGFGCSSTRSATRPTSPSRSPWTWSSRSEGGEGPTPYEVLLHAAMTGDSKRFTRQDARRAVLAGDGAAARGPTAGAPVREGIVGSRGGREGHFRLRTLASTLGGDMSTTVKNKRTASRTTNGRRGGRKARREAKREDRDDAAERGGALAVHPDRRVRFPVGLPHRCAGRAGRDDRLAVRPAV